MSEESKPLTHRYLARVTIEFRTPFHIGSGETEGASDAGVVRDWNGLPALPGPSLTGVLRDAFETNVGEDLTKKILGYQQGKDGQGSALDVSWGLIHNSTNEVVEAPTLASELKEDDILRNALNPTMRDHVRLNHRGTVDGDGKFDQLTISAGHRFTFELELTGDESDEGAWNTLLGLLRDPGLRLGGKTRRGLGSFAVHRLRTKIFDLNDDVDFTTYLAHSPSLAVDVGDSWSEVPATERSHFQGTVHSLSLVPEDYWIFGGGFDPDGEVDSVAVRDDVIVWNHDKAEVKEMFVIPGSSVKGAISHRVAYHDNRLRGIFADGKSETELREVTGENNPSVKNLFGEKLDHDKGRGRAGRVFIDDLFFDCASGQPVPVQPHVAIDGFTGGARDGMLFNDRPLDGSVLPGGQLELRILMRPDQSAEERDTELAEKALGAALWDLKNELLPLGAHAGRGYGFFTEAKKEENNE